MSLSLILDRMASRDKDFRYMATSDLLVELQKETFKMDSESERKLCQMSIKLLSDAAGDVQGLAVKWCARRARAHRASASAAVRAVVRLAIRSLALRPHCAHARARARPRARVRRRAAYRCSCARCRRRTWRRWWIGCFRW